MVQDHEVCSVSSVSAQDLRESQITQFKMATRILGIVSNRFDLNPGVCVTACSLVVVVEITVVYQDFAHAE